MQSGTIIFLNGTSSAGKTTLAHQLQEILPEPYFHMALDQFRDGMPPQYRGLNAPEGTLGHLGLNVVPVNTSQQLYTRVCFGSVGKQMLKGMRRAIAAMVESGNNIIIDDVLLETEFLEDYLDVFAGQRVYFVGVKCSREELDRRETSRPGRFPGTATGHMEICHAHETYDIEVHTHYMTPLECAVRIVEHINQNEPEAFNSLRHYKQETADK